MGYRDDPEARSTLNAALTGLGVGLVWLAIVAGVSFFIAVQMAGGGGGH